MRLASRLVSSLLETDLGGRQGQCFPLSYREITKDFPNSSPARLIHGIITQPVTGKKFPHAWIDDGKGKIYDPVLDVKFTVEKYRDLFKPVETESYTAHEAMILAVRTRNYGPWTDSEIRDARQALKPKSRRR